MTFLAERVHELHTGAMKGLDSTSTRIATGGADGVVRLLSVNGSHIGTSTASTDAINAVALGPHGRVVFGGRDRRVRLFDAEVGRSYVLGEHDHWVMSVVWSGSGDRILSGSYDGTIGMWEPEGSAVTQVRLGAPVTSVDWVGDVIAATTFDGVVHLLDPSGTVHRTMAEGSRIPWSVALSPDSQTVAWTGQDRHLRIAGVDGDAPIAVPAHTAQVWSVAWDAAGDRIATASADATAAIWSPDGTALERITTRSWLRRALFRGVELHLASEGGELLIYSSDGVTARPPDHVEPPGPPTCSHGSSPMDAAPHRPRCADCGAVEDQWICTTCGDIGCSDAQLSHATKHWIATGHPVASRLGGNGMRWCYADDTAVTE